ncbi:MAG: ADP-ribosylglycohydrolase family protein [Chthoniobacteraceae bacterium]
MTPTLPTAAGVELPPNENRRTDALAGLLIGTAVGDALGLPMEGLSAQRQRRLFPSPLRHRLVGRFGMISDDTEHTLMLAQALLECPTDPAAFQRALARRLRWWLVGLPAGVGFATLRAILKLWMGIPPSRSGVVSAGNGPAMRTALLGVYFADTAERRRQFVRASTQITHRDPRAEIAALAVAETAAWMAEQRDDVDALLQSLSKLSDLFEWTAIIAKIGVGLSWEQPTPNFAHEMGMGRGVSVYAFQSVPAAIYAALRHRNDFEAALTEAIACGGDTDTVGAITGALVGARVGVAGIPASWRSGIVEWPRSLSLLHSVGERLSRQLDAPSALGPVAYFWPAIPLRNLAFLIVVLAHGFRRIIPPY